ncbi:MAG TPA: RNA polymerase sigma factor [Rhizomicrobium sp.]|nr:RNA polymerase sigma factor [Rhizomicrobium sp.]
MDEKASEPDRVSRKTSGLETALAVEAWFVGEVLPLEAILMHFLRHNWRDQSDIEDLRQEVYMRVCEAAFKAIPETTKSFVLATARNLLIDRVRRGNVVPIDAVADLDVLGIAIDTPSADQRMIAHEELERLQFALAQLPQRCREVIVMRRIEERSGREIATRMGITEATVWEYLADGVRALADILYGEEMPHRRRRK